MTKKKLLIDELQIGMFVEELDRPWLETPYFLEGIHIESQADIDELSRHCQYVFISSDEEPLPEIRKPIVTTPSENSINSPTGKYKNHVIPKALDQKTEFHGDYIYQNVHSMEEELPAARKAHETAEKLINQIKVDINRDFQLNTGVAKELVDVISSSIIKNPEAMLFLSQLKSDTGHYQHALNSAIYMITLGRYLCLPTEELSILGLGGLLMDIGLLKLPQNSEDSSKDHKSIDKHVTYGEELLIQIPAIPEKVIQITAQHHEREDGTGYPRGLRGSQIAPYARMAAIIDCYERMISQGINEYSPPVSPFEALKTLWDWTRNWLNATLVQQFAHCIGLFPVGSLVELNSGEVAIVLTHNRSNRLLPRIMVVLDPQKQPYASPMMVDLISSATGPQGKPYEIVQDLKPNAYGINPKEYYL